jgi:methyl-accepting chemotaxis protein
MNISFFGNRTSYLVGRPSIALASSQSSEFLIQDDARVTQQIQEVHEDVEKIQEVHEDAEKIQEVYEDAEKMVPGDAEKIQEVHEDAEKIQEVHEDAEKIQEVHEDAEKIQEVHGDAETVADESVCSSLRTFEATTHTKPMWIMLRALIVSCGSLTTVYFVFS